MTRAATGNDRAIDLLLAYAADWSGFQPESVARTAIARALARELESGTTVNDVLERASRKDPELVRTIRSAVGVRETFLFRNPEQFELIASRVPGLAASGVVRAWSAGCATGEEAWSLAATIVANLPGQRADPAQTFVLGTDLHEPGVEHARAGRYRMSSQRPSGPLLFPVVRQLGDQLEVLEPLRAITSFAVHDLREPPPGEFELILCRNVLIYFARHAAREVLANLAAALVPGGLLICGTMDLDASELPQLARVGRPELMAFTPKPTPAARSRKRPTTLNLKPADAPAPPTLPPAVVALHRNALMWIELGGRASAEKALAQLNQQHPEYVPGLLERALSHARRGDYRNAARWMTEVLRRIDGRPDDELVLGLEELPVAFYRETARSFLDREDKS